MDITGGPMASRHALLFEPGAGTCDLLNATVAKGS